VAAEPKDDLNPEALQIVGKLIGGNAFPGL
jgi:hypothetical protein